MTADLDTMARAAAVDLHRRTDAVDTEAALAALHRSTGSGRHRMRRRVHAGRACAAVAAAVLVVAALALAVQRFGGDEPERLGTAPPQAVDPSSYGPLLGRLHGVDAPDLTAEVHGPEALDDGSEVAVSITGGRPGQHYGVSQCAVSDEAFNPAANCTIGNGFDLDDDGNGTGVFRVWSVFEPGALQHRNDCRVATCELQIGPVLDDGDGDTPPAGTVLAEQPDLDEARSASPWIPLRFAADAGAPPLPEVTATFVAATPEGIRVRLEGTDLHPGRAVVEVSGFDAPGSGLTALYPSVGPVEVTTIDVAADGRVSEEVELPAVVREPGARADVGGNEAPAVTCGASPAYCEVRIVAGDGVVVDDGAGRGPLTAPPVRYPEPR